MPASIVESLTSLITPVMRGAVASQLDETEPSISTAVRGAFGAILAVLLARTNDQRLLEEVAELINHGEFALPPPDELSAVSPMLTDESPASSVGLAMLQRLFNGRLGAAGDAIARASGVSAKSARSVLALAAPFVLGHLRRTGPRGGFDAPQLAAYLEQHREPIEDATPAGLEALTHPIVNGESDGAPRAMSGGSRDAPVSPRRAHAARARNRWARPLLVIASVAAVLAVFWPRSTTNVAPPEPPDSTLGTTAGAGSVADSAAGLLADTPAQMAARVRRVLPGGRELNVAEGSIEARLADLLADSAAMRSESAWLVFDRVSFESQSAVLAASSSGQLDNIADILRDYPDATVQIGGYTSNRGSAEANHELSDGRAEAVKAALVLRGVDARRITAEGYGSLYPVASNDTEEGRRLNERVSLRLSMRQ